nr:hypothetical protein [uncultured Draconibacterium sp.]
MSILEMIQSILLDLASRFFLKLLSIIKIKFGIKASYESQLVTLLNKMPFIYHDLEGSVLNDFVEIEADQLDILSLERNKNEQYISYKERLKEKPRALFLGSAGIGKTTFFRYVLLNLLKSKEDIPFFTKHEKKKLIPIYVPLKIIDNNSHSPIYNYITENIKLFKGKSGKKFLLKKANRGEIFLLLDGYDEITLITKSNFIKAEVEHFFNEKRSNLINEVEFYEAMKYSKVWLSSRKEFYKLNSFNLNKGINEIKAKGVITGLELKGIGDNRIKLVKLIFDKYKKVNSYYEELLDEEFFIRNINNAYGEEIEELTKSPLFMIVITYIYVNDVKASGNIEVFNYTNYVKLIIKCIKLLLEDLDKEKVRGYPKAKELAHLHRRNMYVDDKLRFLKYFAAELYINKKSVFTYDYLCQKAKEYFEKNNSSDYKKSILDGLEHKGNDPNFVEQLIYCAIFTLVGSDKGENIYDFPHRRFREVLAGVYFEESNRHKFVLKLVDNITYSEFLYVFFKITQKKDLLLKKIFEKVLEETDTKYNNLAQDCIASTINFYDPTNIIVEFLQTCISKNKTFHLSSEIIKKIKYDSNFISYLVRETQKLVNDNKHYSLKICLSTLQEMNVSNVFEESDLENIRKTANEINFIIILDYHIKISNSLDQFYINFKKDFYKRLLLILFKNLKNKNIEKFEEWIVQNKYVNELLLMVKYSELYGFSITNEYIYLRETYELITNFEDLELPTDSQQIFFSENYMNKMNLKISTIYYGALDGALNFNEKSFENRNLIISKLLCIDEYNQIYSAFLDYRRSNVKPNSVFLTTPLFNVNGDAFVKLQKDLKKTLFDNQAKSFLFNDIYY